MSQPSAPERLARELPDGTMRRALIRLERLRAIRRRGDVLRVWVDSRGDTHVVESAEQVGALECEPEARGA